MQVILTECTDEGLNKMVELKFETKKEFNQLVRKIIEDDYGEDYLTENREVNLDELSEEEVFKFLSNFLDSSYVDSDYSEYKLFDKKTLEEIKASKIVFDIKDPLVDINICTRNPGKWFIIDSETEQFYKIGENGSFVSLKNKEINKIKKICIKNTEN